MVDLVAHGYYHYYINVMGFKFGFKKKKKEKSMLRKVLAVYQLCPGV